MQPEEKQLDASAFGVNREGEQQDQALPPGSAGRRLRASAARAMDRGKRVAEMILECNEDGEHGDTGHVAGFDGVEDAEFVGDEGGGNGSSLHRRKPVKTRWSAAEDAKLKQLVDVHGSGNWRVVSGRGVEVGVGGVRQRLAQSKLSVCFGLRFSMLSWVVFLVFRLHTFRKPRSCVPETARHTRTPSRHGRPWSHLPGDNNYADMLAPLRWWALPWICLGLRTRHTHQQQTLSVGFFFWSFICPRAISAFLLSVSCSSLSLINSLLSVMRWYLFETHSGNVPGGCCVIHPCLCLPLRVTLKSGTSAKYGWRLF